MPPGPQTLEWRPMVAPDLDRVAEIAVLGFPDHFEGRAVFADRLRLYPRGCFVLADGKGPPIGYLIAYPWSEESAPPLNTVIETLPDHPALIYLHDLAIHPDARGGGRTAAIVERLADQARSDGWPALALVAVNAAAEFWRRHGFEERAGVSASKLASYGADACYMRRSL